MKTFEYVPYDKKGKYVPFTRYAFFLGIIPNLISVLLVFLYSVNFVNIDLKTMLLASGWVVLITAFGQMVAAPVTNKFISQKISTKLNLWSTVGLDEKERTTLIKEVLRFPFIKSLEVYFHFFVCSIELTLVMIFILKVDTYTSGVMFITLIAASFLAMILSLSVNEQVCSKIAIKLYDEGIDRKNISEKKYFGMSLTFAFVLHIVVPVLFGAIFTVLTGMQSFYAEGDKNWFLRVIYVSITDIAFFSVLTGLFFLKIRSYSGLMHDGLEAISKNSSDKLTLFPVDLATEFSYALHLVNKTIIYFNSMMTKTANINERIVSSATNLSAVSKETESTAMEQSTSVEEILATMVNTESLSHTIESKIREVIKVAQKTTEDVNTNFKNLHDNLNKMKEITDSNQTTILGIQSLCTKINNVRDIVNLIDSVAEQTKIIAFNAELEASMINSSDESFHNVAIEIRTLADKTMNLTKEIKEKINEIQRASETLILTSQNCTGKIKEGNALTERLEKKFHGIKFSAVTTAEDSQEIVDYVQEQTNSYNQLVSVLSQINTGVKGFSESSQLITTTVASLQNSAGYLRNLNKNFHSTGESL